MWQPLCQACRANMRDKHARQPGCSGNVQVGNASTVLGFVGAPFTLASYIVEGGSSKTYSHIKKMAFSAPEVLHALNTKLAESVAEYVRYQVPQPLRSSFPTCFVRCIIRRGTSCCHVRRCGNNGLVLRIAFRHRHLKRCHFEAATVIQVATARYTAGASDSVCVSVLTWQYARSFRTGRQWRTGSADL